MAHDSLQYYGYIHGEIGKARTRRDLAVAQLILAAADTLARYVATVVVRGLRKINPN